jgi:hypothetical protein
MTRERHQAKSGGASLTPTGVRDGIVVTNLAPTTTAPTRHHLASSLQPSALRDILGATPYISTNKATSL